MKKVTFLFFCFLMIICAQSCQDHFKVESPVGRSYQQDVAVLNEFVDINKTTHEYFINPNKRNSALSYITNADAEELNSVNSANLNLFKQSLKQVSSEAGQMAASHGADYVVMITNDDIYISKTKSNSPLDLKSNYSSTRDYQPTMASVQVIGERALYSVYTNNVETSIELSPASYQNAGWSFWVTCRIGDYSNKETVRVLFCGVGFHTNLCFEWLINGSYDQRAAWDFEVKSSSNNDSPAIATLNFSHQ